MVEKRYRTTSFSHFETFGTLGAEWEKVTNAFIIALICVPNSIKSKRSSLADKMLCCCVPLSIKQFHDFFARLVKSITIYNWVTTVWCPDLKLLFAYHVAGLCWLIITLYWEKDPLWQPKKRICLYLMDVQESSMRVIITADFWTLLLS